MKQKKLALSLRGGGAKCHSYLGLLKLLEEEGVKVDFIIGSSGGAVVGGCYASGFSIEEILEYSSNIDFKGLVSYSSLRNLNFADVQKVKKHIMDFIGDSKIEDSKIKFWAQLTNLDTRENKIMDSGFYHDILLASIAFPFLTAPIKIGESLYGDGDMTSCFEASFLKRHGAETVIGLECTTPNSNHSVLSLHTLEPFFITKKRMLEVEQRYDPVDLLIKDLDQNIGTPFDFKKAYEFYEQGYKVSRLAWKDIRDKVYSSKKYFVTKLFKYK